MMVRWVNGNKDAPKMSPRPAQPKRKLLSFCGGEYHQVVREGANFELKKSDLRAAKKRNLLSNLPRPYCEAIPENSGMSKRFLAT